MLFLPRCYNDEIIINTKTYFHTDEKLFQLFCSENDFAKYFAKFHNLSVILFYDNFSKLYISIRQDTLNFLVLHNFTKCFSGTRVNQLVKRLKG